MFEYNPDSASSKAEKYLSYNSGFMPVDTGNVMDLKNAFKTAIHNHYRGCVIGIGHPLSKKRFPKKSEISKWIKETGADLPRFEKSYDDLSGRTPKNGNHNTHFERMILLGKVLRGEVDFDPAAKELLEEDYFSSFFDGAEKIGDISVIPKFPHNAYPWLFDMVVRRDKQGYFEPDKKSVEQVMYLDDARGELRASEKGPYGGRNIDIIPIVTENHDNDLIKNRSSRLITEESERKIIEDVRNKGYNLCIIPGVYSNLTDDQMDLIEKTYHKSMAEGREMVVAVSCDVVPMDPKRNYSFWLGMEDRKRLPHRKLEGVKSHTKAFARGNGKLPLSHIHFTYIETENGSGVAKTPNNNSFLPENYDFVKPDQRDRSKSFPSLNRLKLSDTTSDKLNKISSLLI